MPYLNNETLRSIVSGGTPNGLVNGGGEDEIFVKDSKGLKSGKYSKTTMQKIIAASKALGVNPYHALAIGLQESGLGTQIKRNSHSRGRTETSIGTVHTGDLFDANDNKTIEQLKAKGLDENALQLALALKKKMAYAKSLGLNDEAQQLQAYNGLGVITPKQFGGSTKAYGVDITNGVDLKKNPLYGKRIQQLMADLSSNPGIIELTK